MDCELLERTRGPLRTMAWRFFVVLVFGIALGFFEAAVVVYLREIFYPDGFDFPLRLFDITTFGKKIWITEIGREAASLVVIFTTAWLSGRNLRQRLAFFATIFAVWDIFYYVWLWVLLGWPASIMDWDVLFLIPCTWGSPVLAPVLVSLTRLVFAVVILYRDCLGKNVKAGLLDWVGFVLAAVIVIVSFCLGGRGITEQDFVSYFSWPLFAVGNVGAVALFLRCLWKST